MSTADRPDVKAATHQALVEGGVIPPPLVDRQALIDLLWDHRRWTSPKQIADGIIASGILRDADEVKADAQAEAVAAVETVFVQWDDVVGWSTKSLGEFYRSLSADLRAALDNPDDVLAKLQADAWDACADEFGGSVWDAPYIKAHNPYREATP